MYEYKPYYQPKKKPANTPVNNYNIAGISKEEYEGLFKEAVGLHNMGISGDKEAVKKAHDLLRKLHTCDMKDVMVEAYLGSATALIGRDVLSPIDKLKYAMKGLKMLDHAVQQEPKNIEIRTLRSKVCLRLPENYFHRTQVAIEDFNYLISRYREDNGVFSEERYWDTLFDLGTAYKNLGHEQEAEEAFEELLSETSSPKYQAMVKQVGTAVQEIMQSSSSYSDEGRDLPGEGPTPKKKQWRKL